MNSFYEKDREENANIHISRNRSHIYPAHYHQNLELLIIKHGRYTISINSKEYFVSDGMIAVIDSYDVHDYICGESTDDCTVVIPFRYLDRFNTERNNTALKTNIIESEELVDKLLYIIDSFIIDNDGYTCDSGVQLILSLILPYVRGGDAAERGDAGLVRCILSYIQNNFKSNITRASIAFELGYTEAHISRVFHKYIGKGITNYINSLRYGYIERQREIGDTRSLTELIYESGFGSAQSYYRHRASLNEVGKIDP